MDRLEPAKDVITALQDDRAEWTHANGVFEQPDGDLLVSFRNISTIVRIDRETGNARPIQRRRLWHNHPSRRHEEERAP